MKTAAAQPLESSAGLATLSDYISLTKPRVVLLILVTALAGFLMAWRGPLGAAGLMQLARMLLGTGLVAGGTLALNQYLERGIDRRMKRTARRPLPDGRMQPLEALAFGGALTCGGLIYTSLAVGPVGGMCTALTVISYLFLYTPLKTRSALCTVVGAFPGALPPLIGWVAAGGELGPGAAALFGILFFWQLPHSLAIAHLYREDYARAGVRLLPTVDWDGGSTGRQTVLNGMALTAAGLMPSVIGMTGWAYGIVALLLGAATVWLGASLALSGLARDARRLLLATYVYMPVILCAMVLDRVPS